MFIFWLHFIVLYTCIEITSMITIKNIGNYQILDPIYPFSNVGIMFLSLKNERSYILYQKLMKLLNFFMHSEIRP